MQNSIGIVGGGLLGMYLALQLREAGAAVTLYEAQHDTGGLAAPEQIGCFRWDRFYHVILMSDTHTTTLIERLGLADQLRWGVTRTGFYTDGALYSLSDAIEFLRFPPLSLVDKLRLGATIFFASRIRNWQALERQPVVDWLTRWSGGRVTEKIWLPLLKSKLGENYRHASAAFLWAIIARMYAARRAGLKREMFGYLDCGYEGLLNKLRARLAESGVQIRTGHAVNRVEQHDEAAVVSVAGGSFAHALVICTLPTTSIARLCPQLGSEEKRRLASVTYQGVACAAMLLRKPLANFYVTNITDRWVPFTGVIEMTALVDRARFGGHSLIYLPCYLTQEDPFWALDDAAIREQFVAALERMYPDFHRDDVVAFNVARARQVLALSTLDYSSALLPPVETSLSRVAIINSAQIAQGTLNVNETLGVAKAGLERLQPRLEQLGFGGAFMQKGQVAA